jgi:trans-L-3-hydroxyproline dehydratase
VRAPILKTIDAHAGGQPLRLLVEGLPAPRGATMLDKREWLERRADRLRRMLMCEPRGHQDLFGALLTEPVSPGSHAGLLFMDHAGFPAMSGHAVLAATRIALDRGLLMPGGDGRTIVYDTPAGLVRVRIDEETITLTNVPAFVIDAGVTVRAGTRSVRADVSFAGRFFAIVDAEAAGVGFGPRQLPLMRLAGQDIAAAVERACRVVHPLEPRLTGIQATVFTGPPSAAGADLNAVAVSAHGAIDRSPGGDSTAAVMAVLSAMGLLADGAPFVQEGVSGAWFTGRVAGRTAVGEHDAILVEIDGSAWITGEHTFLADPPLSP